MSRTKTKQNQLQTAHAESKARASKKQQELLNFISGFILGNGYGPSYREIMRGLDYKSVSTVAIHVDSLIAKGYLTKLDHSARSLTVVGKTLAVPAKTATKADTNWLIAEVNRRFELYQKNPSSKLLDEMFVLVGALQVLGLTEAALSFKTQLTNLAK